MHMAVYEAHAFHDGFERGRGSGTLNISSDGIRFEGSGKSVSFPLASTQFKLGGASDRLVFMTHAIQPGWTLYTSDLSILDNEALRDAPGVREQLNRVRRRRIWNWSVLVLGVVALVAMPVVALTNVDWITGMIARKIPAEWEAKLGESTFAQYQHENEMMASEEGARLQQVLTEPLITAAASDRYTFHIAIVHDEEVNAFALPGGYIVINSGLIIAAGSADEMLGVLAHEMAHVTEQHGVRNVIGGTSIFALVQALFGDVGGVLAVVVDAAPLLIHQSYSRGFEAQADEKGFALLRKAAIDPQGLTTFFERVRETEDAMLSSIEDATARALAENAVRYLSSHPASDQRIARLKELIARQDVAEFRDLDSEFQRFKSLVKQFALDHTEDVDEV